MNRYFVGIAGGSGSGKSTLAYNLQSRYPPRIGVLELDDFQKTNELLSLLEGMPNRDHPSSVDFDSLISSINLLKNGEPVSLMTKSLRLNPGYAKGGWRIPYTVMPKEIMLIEGYCALWHPEVRSSFDYSIFLDASEELRVTRRSWRTKSDYIEKVLLPMHNQYIEPAKVHADLIINVDGLDEGSLASLVEEHLKSRNIL